MLRSLRAVLIQKQVSKRLVLQTTVTTDSLRIMETHLESFAAYLEGMLILGFVVQCLLYLQTEAL